jgi:hypothetical protein
MTNFNKENSSQRTHRYDNLNITHVGFHAFCSRFAKIKSKIPRFSGFYLKFGNFEYFFTNTLKHLYRGCYGQKIG